MPITTRGWYALADAQGRPVGHRHPGSIITERTRVARDPGAAQAHHAVAPVRTRSAWVTVESTSFTSDEGTFYEVVPDEALVPDPYGLVPPGGRWGFWFEEGRRIWLSPIQQLDSRGRIAFYDGLVPEDDENGQFRPEDAVGE